MKKKTKTRNIFVGYSHKDEAWMRRLLRHMESRRRTGVWTVWHDGDIRVGDDWPSEIEKTIAEADATVPLVSEDFLKSDFIRETEIPALRQRKEDGQLKVFPLVIRACDWNREDWLNRIEVRPKDCALESLGEEEIDRFLTKFMTEIEEALREDAAIVLELGEELPIEADAFGLLHVRDGKDQIPESGPLLNNEMSFEQMGGSRLRARVRYRGNLGFQFKCFVDYDESGLTFEKAAEVLRKFGFRDVTKGAGKGGRAWFLLADYGTCQTVDGITTTTSTRPRRFGRGSSQRRGCYAAPG